MFGAGGHELGVTGVLPGSLDVRPDDGDPAVRAEGDDALAERRHLGHLWHLSDQRQELGRADLHLGSLGIGLEVVASLGVAHQVEGMGTQHA